MDNGAFGLVVNPVTLVAQLEAIIGVLVIRRLEISIEAPQLQEKRPLGSQQSPRTIVHLTNIVIHGCVDVRIELAEVGTGAVREDNPSRFL